MNRLRFLCVLVVGVTIASAQKPTTKNLGLVGDRFKPLKYEEMTPAQKTMIDHLLAGERAGVGGPFNVLLRSPEMGDIAQQFGAAGRFHSALSPQVRETVIILTARFWMAQYEWSAHKKLALEAGVSPAIVDAIANGKRPPSMEPELQTAYNFMTELLRTRQVSDPIFAATKEKFGERGIVDMIGLAGWYTTVSLALNTDRYPLAPGSQPELKALANPIP